MKRERIIPVRVSEEEYTKLKQKAEEKGLSISAYLRTIGLTSQCQK